eukprot:5121402-Prymnesium_polylepis.1
MPTVQRASCCLVEQRCSTACQYLELLHALHCRRRPRIQRRLQHLLAKSRECRPQQAGCANLLLDTFSPRVDRAEQRLACEGAQSSSHDAHLTNPTLHRVERTAHRAALSRQLLDHMPELFAPRFLRRAYAQPRGECVPRRHVHERTEHLAHPLSLGSQRSPCMQCSGQRACVGREAQDG